MHGGVCGVQFISLPPLRPESCRTRHRAGHTGLLHERDAGDVPEHRLQRAGVQYRLCSRRRVASGMDRAFGIQGMKTNFKAYAGSGER